MKNVLSICLAGLCVVSVSTFAQDSSPDASKKISAGQAAGYVGKSATVTGTVAQVTIREKLVYLNLDKPFPDSPFSAVIFAKNTNQFDNLPALKGKNVEIKGTVEEYRGKPQIVLEGKWQLKVGDIQKPSTSSSRPSAGGTP